VTIDLDQLLYPIENAPDAKSARAAVWDVLRQVRHANWDYDDDHRQVFRNILAAVDAVAWVAGLSEGFRANACITAWRYATNRDDFRVIPASFPSNVPGALSNA
jgi:hypothetical protein